MGSKTRRHDTVKPSKFKTSMCTYFTSAGGCPFGSDCAFAHGKDELRAEGPMPTPAGTDVAGRSTDTVSQMASQDSRTGAANTEQAFPPKMDAALPRPPAACAEDQKGSPPTKSKIIGQKAPKNVPNAKWNRFGTMGSSGAIVSNPQISAAARMPLPSATTMLPQPAAQATSNTGPVPYMQLVTGNYPYFSINNDHAVNMVMDGARTGSATASISPYTAVIPSGYLASASLSHSQNGSTSAPDARSAGGPFTLFTVDGAVPGPTALPLGLPHSHSHNSLGSNGPAAVVTPASAIPIPYHPSATVEQLGGPPTGVGGLHNRSGFAPVTGLQVSAMPMDQRIYSSQVTAQNSGPFMYATPAGGTYVMGYPPVGMNSMRPTGNPSAPPSQAHSSPPLYQTQTTGPQMSTSQPQSSSADGATAWISPTGVFAGGKAPSRSLPVVYETAANAGVDAHPCEGGNSVATRREEIRAVHMQPSPKTVHSEPPSSSALRGQGSEDPEEDLFSTGNWGALMFQPMCSSGRSAKESTYSDSTLQQSESHPLLGQTPIINEPIFVDGSNVPAISAISGPVHFAPPNAQGLENLPTPTPLSHDHAGTLRRSAICSTSKDGSARGRRPVSVNVFRSSCRAAGVSTFGTTDGDSSGVYHGVSTPRSSPCASSIRPWDEMHEDYCI